MCNVICNISLKAKFVIQIEILHEQTKKKLQNKN